MSRPLRAPLDPDFAARVRASFERQAAMKLIGAGLLEVAPGFVVVTLAHREALTQQHGFVHAGIVATALDSACGYAASTLMPADAGVLTVEFKINLLAPARGPAFRFEGRVTKAGRTISVVDGRALQGDDDEVCASMTATIMTVQGRAGVQH